MSKILIYDIETTPIAAYTWNLWPNGISHDSIIQDWSIICACWKWLDKDKIHSSAVSTVGNDYNVVCDLYAAIAEADIIVHHNGDKFDLKKLNARIIKWGMEPLPNIQTVDTLKEVKKIAAFSSNRLDYIAKFLTGQGKVHVEYDLWLRVMAGSKSAIKEMVEYNKVDVKRLKDIYLWLLPYMKSHPHVGAKKGLDRNCSCPKCGSKELKKNGIRYTKAGIKRQEVQCKKCYAYSLVKYEEA